MEISPSHLVMVRALFKSCDFYIFLLIFTALYGMQTRSSDENFVRPSVCQMREL